MIPHHISFSQVSVDKIYLLYILLKMKLKKATYHVGSMLQSVIYHKGSSITYYIKEISDNKKIITHDITLEDALEEIDDIDTPTWASILDTSLCYIQTSIDYPIPEIYISGDWASTELDIKIEDLYKKISPLTDNGILVSDNELVSFFTKHFNRFNNFNVTSDDNNVFLHLETHEDQMLWMMLR